MSASNTGGKMSENIDSIEITETIAFFPINKIDMDRPIGGENVVYFLRFQRRTSEKCIVNLQTGGNLIGCPEEMDIKDIARRLTKKSTTIVQDIIDVLQFGGELSAETQRIIRSGCGKIWTAWLKGGSGGDITLPDFYREMPLKLPFFGYTEHKNIRYLTEGFWAVPEGGIEPQIYVLILKQNLRERGESGESQNIEKIEKIIDIFDNEKSQHFQFKTDILPPPYTQEWLVSRNVLRKMQEEEIQINKELNKNIFALLYNLIIPKHLWIENVGERKTLAYWIMGTYFYNVFDAYPIGHGWGFYGSGKSRLAMLIVSLAYHGMFGIDITTADLFRTKEEFKPTLVIDENEDTQREIATIKDDLINGSYVRGGGSVSRRREVKTDAGKVYVRDTFNLYSPTFFCSINPMRSPQSRSRVITFPMIKKDVKVPICERKDYEELENNLYEFMFMNWTNIRKLYEELRDIGIPKINTRNLELWLPIFTIMKYIGRWDEDFEDVFKFQKFNERYQKEADLVDEERPTLYRAISKLYWEAKNDIGDRWYRHPNNQEHLYEFEVKDLTLVMQQIGSVIGYTKNIDNNNVGRALRMLGFSKSRHPDRKIRRTTFIINMKLFENICYDHLGYTPDDLGERDYDSMEKMIHHPKGWIGK